MAWLDFTEAAGFPERAAWSLDWDPEALEEDVLRGPRVYLNRSHKRLREALEGPPAGARDLLEMIHFDLGRTLISGALRNPDFAGYPSAYGEGTVGRSILNLLRLAFPAHSPRDLASRMVREPGRFERELQHGLRILEALE